MTEQATAPAEQEQIETPEPVRNAEAVLKKNQELLAENAKYKALAKQAEGFDFEKAKAAMDAIEAAEHDKLTKKGEWDKLKEKLEQRHGEELTKANAEKDRLLSNLKQQTLKTFLTENGVLPDRAKYALADINDRMELVSDDNGFSLKLKDGIGDAKEMQGVIGELRTTSPFLFAPTAASGSGASGSNGGSPTAKTASRSEWDGWTAEQRSSFAAEGGTLTN